MAAENVKLEQLAREISQLAATHQPYSADGEVALKEESPLVAKAKELIAVASSPTEHATDLLQKLVEAAVLRSVQHLKVLENIPLEGSISLKDLALATKTEDRLLRRLLRVIVGTGFLTLAENDQYAHTKMSAGYIGVVSGFFDHCLDMTIIPMLEMPRYLAAKGNKEPTSFTHNPLTFYEGQEGKTPFDILAQNEERMKHMHSMMVLAANFRPYTGFYDYSKLTCPDEPERAVFVDVGGGNGHVIQKVLEGHADIRAAQCVLQDRVEVIEMTKKQWTLDSGVQMIPHDFFTKQPVRGARAFHFRAVFHDLGDEDVVKILQRTVDAMAPDSKILIAECIIDERYNKGIQMLFDPMMMQIGGKERTEKEFSEVLGQAGLRLERVYPSGTAGWGILEAGLA